MVARWKKKRGNPAVAESSLFCYNGVYSWLCLSIGFCRDDRYITSVLAAHLELHCTVYQGVESVVAAHADVLARVELRTSLADDDVASLAGFTAEYLDA